MGYEITRFTHDVDEEFHCLICKMIMKDPMQSPCDHLFCNECIVEWLAVDGRCPVERRPFKLHELKPPTSTVRNRMNELEIRCDFEGCDVMVKLDNLQDHIGRCEHNPNAMVICDKGCNIEICRQEYESNNCFRHLADQAARHQEKMLNLNNHLTRQHETILKLSGQNDENEHKIDELNDEICSLRGELKRFQNAKDDSILDNKTKEVNEPVEFRVWDSMNICIKQPKVLETFGRGIAQSVHALNPARFSFQIKVLSFERSWGSYIRVGLAPKYQSTSALHGFASIKTGWTFNGRRLSYIRHLNREETIGCGIRFTRDSNDYGSRVSVYFNINRYLLTEEDVTMPTSGFYPTIEMRGHSIIRYITY